MSKTSIELDEHFSDYYVHDYLLILWPWLSSKTVKSFFEHGKVRVNNRPISPWSEVGEHQHLEFVGELSEAQAIPTPPFESTPEPTPIFEDHRMIVLSKPAGLSVIPDRDRQLPSCLSWLIQKELEERKTKSLPEYLRYRIVHRIDRLTSGLVIVAKTPDVEKALARDFENHEVGKEYLAILQGEVRPAQITVNCPIGPGRKGKMRAGFQNSASDALTTFTVLSSNKEATLVSVQPQTGRTHQIRVHAWAMGHPLILDPKYGPKQNSTFPHSAGSGDRLLSLHSYQYSLSKEWPQSRSFKCLPPMEFTSLISQLKLKLPPAYQSR